MFPPHPLKSTNLILTARGQITILSRYEHTICRLDGPYLNLLQTSLQRSNIY